MAEAMLAHPPSYFWLERSLHMKPREIDWTGCVWTWKRGKGGPQEVIAGGGEGQRPDTLAKKTLCSPAPDGAPVVDATGGKVRFRLKIRAFSDRSKMESAVLTSLLRPIHTRLQLESDFGLLPLVYCG